MAMFGLNREEIQNGYDNAARNPYDPIRDSAPSWYEGSVDAIGSGFTEGVGKAMLLDYDVNRRYNPQYSQDDEAIRQGLVAAIDDLKPSPQTTGWLGDILHGVTSFLPPLVAGSIVGGPIGGAITAGAVQGNATRDMLQQIEGVDLSTAETVGGIEGVAAGLGVVAPVAIPGGIAMRSASGAAINSIIGGAQRGATGAALEASGYHDMAAQYKVLDASAIFTDAILGSAFGALHSEGMRPEALPSEIDAALAANNVRHLELDSAPGIPTDIATRNAHIAGMDTGLEQALRGEPVDVSGVMADASFIPKEIAPEARADMDAALSEHGLGDLANPETRMAELESRLNAEDLSGEERAAIRSQMDELADQAVREQVPATENPYTDIDAKIERMKPEMKALRLETLNKKLEAGIASTREMYEREALSAPPAKATATFESRFGKSVVVDESGEPLRVYHGTSDDVKALQVGHPNRKDAGWLGEGIYATDNPDGASIYAKIKKGDAGPNVMPLYLRMENPHMASLDEKQTLRSATPEQIKAYTDDLKAKGHDGVILEHQDGTKEYVVFDADQAISTFDRPPPPDTPPESIIAAEKPDMPVATEDGQITASEALAKADADVAQAEKDSTLFETAINCFLRFGE